MRVLLLSGTALDVDAIRQSLLAFDPDSQLEVCAPEATSAWLKQGECDAIIIDAGVLGEGSGLLVPALRAQRPQVPIAVLVNPGDADQASRARLSGADAWTTTGHGDLSRLGALLLGPRRRDLHAQRRVWRLWYAGRDSDLRRELAQQQGDRVLLMALSADGRLVPRLEDPSAATALVVDGRDAPADVLRGLERVRDAHPALPTIVVADDPHHVAFLAAGVDDCLPAGADAERVLLAVERLVSARQMTTEMVALRARENRLRALVEYLPHPVVLVSPARTVLAVNLAGLELLGAEEARQVIGRELSEWLAPRGDDNLDAFVDAVSGGRTLSLTASTRHAAGARPVALRAVPFQREAGKPASVLLALRDDPLEVAPVDTAATSSVTAEAEVEALRAEVSALSQALAEAQETAAYSADQLAAAQAASAMQAASAPDESAAIDRVSVTNLEQMLADERARAERLEATVNDLQASIAEAGDVQAVGERLERELAQAQAAAAEAQRGWAERLATLEHERDGLHREMGRLSEAHDARAHALAVAPDERELKDLRARVDTLEHELSHARAALESQSAPARLEAAIDEETRWLLYEVASIGHLTTTPEAQVLAANDMAAQLLGHFSRDTLQASGRLPEPLLLAAGPFAQRPSRFEVCLQHGDDGPLHWIVGLATPHAGVPATVTWMLIDVSEHRLQGRRARFLRRMEAMTHVLSAATAETTSLVDRAEPLLDAAVTALTDAPDVDVEGTRSALTRTKAMLTQLSGFARNRARRADVRDLNALVQAASAMLVHLAGEDILCSVRTHEVSLHATIEPAEFDQWLTALVLAARDALPLGGQLAITTRPVDSDTRSDDTSFARPAVELMLHAQGYGARRPGQVAALEETAIQLGASLAVEFEERGDVRFAVRMARVFLMQ